MNLISSAKWFRLGCPDGMVVILSVLWLALMLVLPPAQALPNVTSLNRVSIEEGLSQGSVTSIMQDANGYVWLGTAEGLNVYDGYQVVPFLDGLAPFSAAYVNFTFQDADDLIWISLYEHGLYQFNPKTQALKLIRASENHGRDDVVAVTQAEDLWFASSTQLLRYNPDTGALEAQIDFSESFADTIFILDVVAFDGYFYVATNSGLYIASGQSGDWWHLDIRGKADATLDMFSQRMRKLLVGPEQQLWMATAGGLFSLDIGDVSQLKDGSAVFELRIADYRFDDITVQEDLLYAASNAGLHAYSLQDGSAQLLLQFSRSNQQIANDQIKNVMHDRNGNFWLSSNSRGVYIWNPKRQLFQNHFKVDERDTMLSDNQVWALAQAKDGSLWVGTANGLNHVQEGSTRQFFVSTQEVLEESSIFQVELAADDTLWVVSPAGIRHFNGETGLDIAIPLKDESHRGIFTNSQSFIYLHQDEVWIATLDSFYRYNNKTGEVTELTQLKEKVNPYYSFGFKGLLPDKKTMTLSASGQLWGIDVDTLEPRVLFELANVSQQSFVYVDHWTYDPKRQWYWMTFTDRGVLAVDLHSREVKVDVEKQWGVTIEPAYGGFFDPNGLYWLSSHNGLYVLNPETEHVRRFDISDGLPALEFNSGAAMQLADGGLVFGSVNGFTRFDPMALELDRVGHERLFVTDFKVANREMTSGHSIYNERSVDVAHDEVGIAIGFSTLTFSQQDKVTYRYTLMGKENVEYPLTRNNYLHYSQLRPGSYRIQAVAISPLDGSETPPVTLTIRVKHAPWASPLAYFTYSATLVLFYVLWLFRRRYKQRLLILMNRDLRESQNRLELALKSSQSRAWQWHREDVGKVNNQQHSLDNLVGPETFKEHYQLIHPSDRDEYLKEWQLLFEHPENDAFNFTYRVKRDDGSWGWYRSVGQIVSRDLQGHPTSISGINTDITEARTAEDSALVFGEAFRNTKDWVLVMDADFNGVTANHSFCRAFGLPMGQRFSFADNAFAGVQGKMQTYREILEEMAIGEHWHGEESFTLNDGTDHSVMINISLIEVRDSAEPQYVVIFTDISAQKTAEQELRQMANYDSLTGLPNRNLLLERIEHAIQLSNDEGCPLAVLFLDLDRFKPVNDSLGHEAGDKLLQEIAKRLQDCVQQQDTVARLGGDEFVILLESTHEPDAVAELASHIVEYVGAPLMLVGHKVSVSPSIGIALYPSDAVDASELIRDADIAMYHAKKDSYNHYHFYTATMDMDVKQKLARENALRQAQQNQEFINFYQPIVKGKDGSLVGAELLLRWQSASGLVPPVDFIPLSEALGLIIPMTYDALERGLADLLEWRKALPHFYLSINLSVIHFEQDDVDQRLAEILQKFDLPASALRIEVTESALMQKPQKAIETMLKFKEMGILLALDDFGTGYSSLSYLKDLPLNIIKIDRSFISGIGQDLSDQAIVDAILGMATSLNMHIVAEGVEKTGQVDYLAQQNEVSLQGYYYSKPKPSNEFSELIYQAGEAPNKET